MSDKSIICKKKFIECIYGGILGLVVGDALGVPVEFTERKLLKVDPVTDMREFGTYNQPKGTWSDDSTMTLCLLKSLTNGLNYDDIMDRFAMWADSAYMTPHDVVFDMGRCTRQAIMRYEAGTSALECGGNTQFDNGNGSLMRILPAMFYVVAKNGFDTELNDEAAKIICNISRLTHAHPKSLMACLVYCAAASALMECNDIDEGVNEGLKRAVKYVGIDVRCAEEFEYLGLNSAEYLKSLPSECIKGDGYVINTIKAAMWCLVTTKSYSECVLRAVNLGDDTDTTAAVAGGLAGIFYGYDAIPKDWLSAIVKSDMIESLCSEFYKSVI